MGSLFIKRLCAAATIAALLACVAACSKEKHFTVKGQIEGLGAQAVSITYFADDGLKRETLAAVDGQFALRGSSAVPTLCFVESSDGTVIATLIIEDGDNVKIRGDIQHPLAAKVTGGSSTEKLAKWVNENAEILQRRDPAEINAAVAEYVGKHKADIVSTALMVTRFQTPGFERMADSLLTMISPKARTAPLLMGFHTVLASQLTKHSAGEVRPMSFYLRTDTIIFYSPASQTLSLLAFRPDGNASTRTDTIVELLRHLSKTYPERRLRVYEISTARDSSRWIQSTARDSATWPQAWAPGSVAMNNIEKLAVPRLPYFVVTDSAGIQVLRTSSASAVRRYISSRLDKSLGINNKETTD